MDNFRWYDPAIKTLYFCGNEYPLEKLNEYISLVEVALQEPNDLQKM